MNNKNVFFIAAENGALPGAKVGGVGDVIRDLPAAVSAAGWPATVLTPSYGTLHRIPGSRELETVIARFRGEGQPVRVFAVPGSNSNVRYVVFEHEFLKPTEPGVVYHGDMPTRPYATDASKFAFFCAAAAAWIASRPTPPAALHLHDWHTAVLAVLREFDPAMAALKSIPQYFTIHNLSYQGQRPLRNDESSLEAWFPELHYDVAKVVDPGASDAFNPMAAAIRLADRVNTVSPTYASEIQRSSNPGSGFIGGEGLESLLRARASRSDLVGIINGCDYSTPPPPALSWQKLIELCRTTIKSWNDNDANAVALETLSRLPRRRPLHVLTSVGRVVTQKMQLFFQQDGFGTSALDRILDMLGDGGVLMLLGSGEDRYEQQLIAAARGRRNLVYICGYSEAIGDALYSSGDLFLMPSSFEPCGISQMLAMRCGQPCIVHAVGGLCDTVDDGADGFVFSGIGTHDQANRFVKCVASALSLRKDDPLRWQKIRNSAKSARFEWQHSADLYVREFYDRRRH